MGKNNKDKRKAKKKLKVSRQRDSEAKKLTVLGSKRPCDGCTLCCSVLGVEPLKKAQWVTCEHVCDAGCGIYSDRPEICGEFNCLWQCGLGTMEERPDKLGVIFAPTNGPTHFTGEEEIQIYEARPGALNSPAVMTICNRLVKKGALIIAHPFETENVHKFMGPKKKVLAAKIAMQLSRPD